MRKLRTEDEIMQNWKSDKSKELVSVCCLTYNHELYIEDALEGFLIQETDFPFEILIHDDASTDKTATIIRDYEAKYPKLIKPIYQMKNQWSQGAMKPGIINFQRAKGKYIAMCEGDDYWIDPNKLQIQASCMCADKSLSLVTHCAKRLISNKFIDNKNQWDRNAERGYFNSQDIVRQCNQFAATSSYFFIREVIDELPAWRDLAPYGDFFIEVYSQKVGRGLYLPDAMSVYRLMTEGSYSKRNKFLLLENSKKQIQILKNLLLCYEKISEDFLEITHADFLARRTKALETICISYLLLKQIDQFRIWIAYLTSEPMRLSLKHRVLSYCSRRPLTFAMLFYCYYIKTIIKKTIYPFYFNIISIPNVFIWVEGVKKIVNKILH